MGECFCKHRSPRGCFSDLNECFTGDLCLTSGHQPHRATHPRHTERRNLQMAARLPQRPTFEEGHL